MIYAIIYAIIEILPLNLIMQICIMYRNTNNTISYKCLQSAAILTKFNLIVFILQLKKSLKITAVVSLSFV